VTFALSFDTNTGSDHEGNGYRRRSDLPELTSERLRRRALAKPPPLLVSSLDPKFAVEGKRVKLRSRDE